MNSTIATNEAAAMAAKQDSEILSSSFRQAYHEVGTQHIVEVDVLEQLKTNMAQLEDLHMRLKFMMGELSYLMKKG